MKIIPFVFVTVAVLLMVACEEAPRESVVVTRPKVSKSPVKEIATPAPAVKVPEAKLEDKKELAVATIQPSVKPVRDLAGQTWVITYANGSKESLIFKPEGVGIKVSPFDGREIPIKYRFREDGKLEVLPGKNVEKIIEFTSAARGKVEIVSSNGINVKDILLKE